MKKKISLFDIGTEFNVLNDLSNQYEVNEETGEFINNDEALKDLFNGIKTTLDVKLDNTMFIIKDMEFEASSFRGQIDYLEAMTKKLKNKELARLNKVNFLKVCMLGAIKASQQDKIKTPNNNFFIKRGESANIASVDELPRQYRKATWNPDKKLIKEVLKSGKKIKGCSLVASESLMVK